MQRHSDADRSGLKTNIAQTNRFQLIQRGEQILRQEGNAILAIAGRIDRSFAEAIELLLSRSGRVAVTGMGKAGLIGQKIVATLASTGTPALYLHPAEAVHGDLGSVQPSDTALALSNSGETEEVLRLLPSLKAMDVPVIAITKSRGNSLGKAACVTLEIGEQPEADPLGLAPSTSTTVMLAIGDALALTLSEHRGFSHNDFARLHPAGSLGRQLAKVDDLMRPLQQCRISSETKTLREILVSQAGPTRRTGAMLLIDEDRCLAGIFTDSDLARLLERGQDAMLDGPISQVMTRSPLLVFAGTMMSEAVQILVERRISELPVVDERRRPLGIIDITDVVAFLPKEPEDSTKRSSQNSESNSNQTAKSA